MATDKPRVYSGDALVFVVEPSKMLAFGKGTFTHMTYRF